MKTLTKIQFDKEYQKKEKEYREAKKIISDLKDKTKELSEYRIGIIKKSQNCEKSGDLEKSNLYNHIVEQISKVIEILRLNEKSILDFYGSESLEN